MAKACPGEVVLGKVTKRPLSSQYRWPMSVSWFGAWSLEAALCLAADGLLGEHFSTGETAAVLLERWFSTIQTLGPFNTVPHAVVTTNRKIISVILCNCREHNRIFLDS